MLATKGGDTVTGCYIGTDSTGKMDKGNTGFGLRISGASSNMIGGHNDPNARSSERAMSSQAMTPEAS